MHCCCGCGEIVSSGRYLSGHHPKGCFKKGVKSWNEGLTAKTDSRLAESGRKISVANSGSNNGMFGKPSPMEGKQHTKESKDLMHKNCLRGSGHPRYGKEGTFKGKKHSHKTRQLMKESASDLGMRANKSIKLKKAWAENDARRSQQSMQSKNLWKDPGYVKKMVYAVSHRTSPNKKEIILRNVVDDLNLQYKYVGDGQFTIGTKCPDFVNINGQKKIIELLGCYWHGCPDHFSDEVKQKEFEDRVQLFKSFGYSTLGIWEHELKDIKSLKCKILKFDHMAVGI